MRGFAGSAAVWWASMATTGCSGLESAADTFCTFNSCTAKLSPQGDPDGSGADKDAGADAQDEVVVVPLDAPRGPWWCEANGTAVTAVLPPATPSPRPTKVRYRLPIIDFSSAVNNAPKPVANATIVACVNSDPDCSQNPTTPFAVVPPSQAAPLYQIDLPYGFNGAIRITAPGYIPTEYFFGGPLLGTPSGTIDSSDGTLVIQGLYITPITEADAAGFFRGGMLVRDPSAGILGPRLLDCNGDRAQGVMLNVEHSTGKGYTLLTNVPVFGDPIPATDSRAVSGFVNMIPGNYQVDAITPRGSHYGRTAAVIVMNTVTIFEIRTDSPGVLGR